MNTPICEKYDLISLGEVMLRLDPGEGRIHRTRSFQVWEGGGEYNVARALSRTFSLRTAVITAFAQNPIGKLLEELILAGGVDTRFIKWVPYDGIGRTVRNGLNFTERGFGIRGAVGCSDRGNSAASQIKPGEIDWNGVLEKGVKWLHTGGIFAGLSATTPAAIEEAFEFARRFGTKISYDLNYRPSLWSANGGKQKAVEVNQKLAAQADLLIGNEEDFATALGYEIDSTGSNYNTLNIDSYKNLLIKVATDFPRIKLIAITLRTVHTATRNDWSAIAYHPETNQFYQSKQYNDLEVLDRVGGGDSFASGLLYGLISGLEVQTALEYGAAHGALAVTTPGDTSMATLAEVQALVSGKNARVVR